MSEYIRYDAADYSGSASSATTIVPDATSLNRDGLRAIDARHFNTASVHLTGTWAGTVIFEGSNDGTNWLPSAGININAGAIVSSVTSSGVLINVPLCFKYFRVRCSAYTSGTIVARVNLTTALSSTLMSQAQITPAPATTIGSSAFAHIMSTASTNATLVKASAGNVASFAVGNNGAAVAYFKLYNKASAPTVGTDTPVATILIPINGTVVYPFAPFGAAFTTGISYAITAGAAVADTTAVAAAQVVGTINYI